MAPKTLKTFMASVRDELKMQLTRAGIEVKSAGISSETIRAFMQGQEIGDKIGTSYTSLVRGGFQKNVHVYRAVTEIALGCASVPLEVFVNDEKVEGPHPFAQLLAAPNLKMTKTRFFIELLSYYLLDGNAFVIATPEDGGAPFGLQILRPDLVTVERLPGATKYTYRPPAPGVVRSWLISDADPNPSLLHFKTFDPLDCPRGMSPLLPARSAMDAHNLADEWNGNVIRNGAKPAGVFIVDRGKDGDAALTDPEREALEKMRDELFVGAKNAAKVPILEGGLKWQQTAWSPAEMDWSGGKATAARDAVTALGFPPMLLGIPGDNTFSNQREARLALWENTIIPLLYYILDELNLWLGPRYGKGVELRANLDRVPALALRRERVWDRVKGSEWLTVNEQRTETGLDKDKSPDADKILVSYNRVPLEDLSQSVVLTQPDANPTAGGTADAGGSTGPGAKPPVK